MRVTVKLFGPEAAAAGRSDVAVDLPGERCDVAALRAALAAACPALADRVAAVRVAVNCEFAEDDDAVAGDDEVALIGQVSGG